MADARRIPLLSVSGVPSGDQNSLALTDLVAALFVGSLDPALTFPLVTSGEGANSISVDGVMALVLAGSSPDTRRVPVLRSAEAPLSDPSAISGRSLTAARNAIMSIRAVATRLMAPPELLDAAKQYVNAETWHSLTEAQSGQIEVWWPNFNTKTGAVTGAGCVDGSSGAVATGTARITYTDATSGSPVTVNFTDKIGGTTALAAPAGGWFKALAPINAAAGSTIKVRIAANFPSGIFYSLGKADITNGDLFQFGTSSIPLATTPTNTFGSYRTWYGPCLIAGLGSKPVMVINGDSRNDGLRDMANDATGALGTLMRLAASAGLAVVNMSGRGETAQTFALGTYSQRRRELAAYGTYIVIANGINDFAQTRTAAQLLADNASIESQFGLPSIWATINPWTTGGIVTPWNGTGDTSRQSYNTSVRAKPCYFDPATVMQAAGNASGWSNEDAVVADYLHETAAGNAYAAANGAIVGTTLSVHGMAARAAGSIMTALGTNLLSNPRDLTQGSWGKNGATIVSTQPDAECDTLGQMVQQTTANAQHNVGAGPITVSNGTYEHWADLAPGTITLATTQIIDGGFTKQLTAGFNLGTGAKGGSFAGTPANLGIADYTITPLTNGFYRCKTTFTISGITSIYISVYTSRTDQDTATYVGSAASNFIARPKMWLRKTA